MLNTRAASDSRHARAGKDGMLYNEKGKPYAQLESFQATASFNNNSYQPLGQNRELEVSNTVGVKISASEIVVLDGELFMAVIKALANGESPVSTMTGVIQGRNKGSEERVIYRDCIFSGDVDIQNVSTGDVLKRSFNWHCNGKVENPKNLKI